MKKHVTFILLLGLMFAPMASAADATYSSELTETQYGWEVTDSIYDDMPAGTTFDVVLSEAVAGMTLLDYLLVDVDVLVDGEEYEWDIFSESNLDGMAFALSLIWALTMDTFDEGYEEDGDSYVLEEDGAVIKYSATSGILQYMDGDDMTMILDGHSEGGFLPFNFAYFFIGLLAIPVIKKYRK